LATGEKGGEVFDLQPKGYYIAGIVLAEDLPLTRGDLITSLLDAFLHKAIVAVGVHLGLQDFHVFVDDLVLLVVAKDFTE